MTHREMDPSVYIKLCVTTDPEAVLELTHPRQRS